MKKQANVLLFKCGKANREYGVRVETTRDNDWVRTWAFEIDPQVARNEGFDQNPIRGMLYATDDYPGCPYCSTDYFVQCGKCKKVSCWHEEKRAQCAWCGNVMKRIVMSKTKFNLKGNNF